MVACMRPTLVGCYGSSSCCLGKKLAQTKTYRQPHYYSAFDLLPISIARNFKGPTNEGRVVTVGLPGALLSPPSLSGQQGTEALEERYQKTTIINQFSPMQ